MCVFRCTDILPFTFTPSHGRKAPRKKFVAATGLAPASSCFQDTCLDYFDLTTLAGFAGEKIERCEGKKNISENHVSGSETYNPLLSHFLRARSAQKRMVEETGLAPATRCLQGSIAPMEHAPPHKKKTRRPGAAPGGKRFGVSTAQLVHGAFEKDGAPGLFLDHGGGYPVDCRRRPILQFGLGLFRRPETVDEHAA